MRRIQYHRYGGPEEMRLETSCSIPTAPAQGDALAKRGGFVIDTNPSTHG
jgi:hypothetical protein